MGYGIDVVKGHLKHGVLGLYSEGETTTGCEWLREMLCLYRLLWQKYTFHSITHVENSWFTPSHVQRSLLKIFCLVFPSHSIISYVYLWLYCQVLVCVTCSYILINFILYHLKIRDFIFCMTFTMRIYSSNANRVPPDSFQLVYEWCMFIFCCYLTGP